LSGSRLALAGLSPLSAGTQTPERYGDYLAVCVLAK